MNQPPGTMSLVEVLIGEPDHLGNGPTVQHQYCEWEELESGDLLIKDMDGETVKIYPADRWYFVRRVWQLVLKNEVERKRVDGWASLDDGRIAFHRNDDSVRYYSPTRASKSRFHAMVTNVIVKSLKKHWR